MGYIRKSLFGAQMVMGIPPVTQFRSDTERVAYQTKKLRQAVERQTRQVEHMPQRFEESRQIQNELRREILKEKPTYGTTDLEADSLKSLDSPPDRSRGWKDCPSEAGLERFWTGKRWSSILRDKPEDGS